MDRTISESSIDDARAGEYERQGEQASPIIVIESCHSTWLFDEENRRFRRLPKGHLSGISTVWRSYDRLVVDDATNAFVALIDPPPGTRLLRSKRHVGPCGYSGGERAADKLFDEVGDLLTTS